jgi:amino acid adenylation domain-containing protein
MLGVLKSGAAFFVADAGYPPARVLDCIQIARPALLLVCGDVALPDELITTIGSERALAHVRLPAEKTACIEAFRTYQITAPKTVPDPGAPAYFGFTSGSTGRPKGIVATHRPLVHFLEWHAKQHGFTHHDRFSLLSGLSHDPALRDIFTPLSIGAVLHIPDQDIIFDPYQLARWLTEQAITVVHLTPALGQIICAGAQGFAPLNQVRSFFWGGDVINSKLSHATRMIAPNARQVNFYGATETPQAMSYFEIDAVAELETYPLGRGIDNVQLLIMPELGRLGEVGELGEIVIRTPYLSQGYLNDADQTRQRFIVNPFTKNPHDRCYKTGDLGKYLSDGTVLFGGRSDHQVKIRGFRVELDEVRAKIEQQAGIARAIVLARNLVSDSKVLVAYYTCNSSSNVESSKVLDSIRQRLPNYMVPSFVVRLDSFPLLPNGKIDLLALPTPGEAGEHPSEESAIPKTDRERELAGLWQSILGVEHVGVNESFLDLGGDSLSAISLLVSMRRLNISESVARGVLQGKTIAEIVRDEHEGGAVPARPAALSVPARTSLLVNCLRGILVVILVAGHWLPGLLKRLPARLGVLQEILDPIFNIATPGFAFVFGISLGYFYYSKYRHHRTRVRHMLNIGLCLIGASVLIEDVLGLAVQAIQGQGMSSDTFWGGMFGSLLYYFLALATAPIWFRIIMRFRSEVAACLGLIVVFYLVQRGCEAVLLQREQTGFLQLCRLMLVAKFAYFNMSLGALGGVAVGIYLIHRRESAGLSARLLIWGSLLVLTGLALLLADRGSLAALADEDDMGLWRWPVYTGAILMLGAALTLRINRYETLGAALRILLNLMGVLGQCSLIIYVLHSVVLRVKVLLVATGLPDPIALALPLVSFLVCCGFMMNKIYRLYYGALITRAGQA